MKRGQVAALLAGATLGLAGVTLAIVISREENRIAARRMLERSGTVADQARKVGQRVARTAVEQYQTTAPKAAGVIGNVMAQAQPAAQAITAKLPQAAEAITAKLPRVSLNGKAQPEEVIS
ncbi:MAG TPA: hypothetical protein VKQ30_15535 [Ktedonobacterales bacterium]|nr:hypothetical protein [Ktedonobacterales bacterium]